VDVYCPTPAAAPNPTPTFGLGVPLKLFIGFIQSLAFNTLPSAVKLAPPEIPHPKFPSVTIPVDVPLESGLSEREILPVSPTPAYAFAWN
jgi:hypothetical protein